MYKQIVKLVVVPAVLAMLVLSISVHASQTAMPEVQEIQQEWSRLYFMDDFKNKNYTELQALARKANLLSQASPDSAEALTWDAIVLSTLAEKKGGLGALSLVKDAKKKLEAAESIDPTVLDGSVYGSLATLYWKVPGWPLGFGSDTKAEQYFGKALKLNPNQLDLNYFYADYLANNNETALALLHLEKAIHAPRLVGRPIADQGRRAQAIKLRDYLLTLDIDSAKVSNR